MNNRVTKTFDRKLHTNGIIIEGHRNLWLVTIYSEGKDGLPFCCWRHQLLVLSPCQHYSDTQQANPFIYHVIERHSLLVWLLLVFSASSLAPSANQVHQEHAPNPILPCLVDCIDMLPLFSKHFYLSIIKRIRLKLHPVVTCGQ